MKRLFSKSLNRADAPLHFAAHSHHPWPDASFNAQCAYWELSARELDRKWERIFSEIVPKAAAHVARILGLADASSIAFATNTHELVARLLSTFPPGEPLRVLTSGSEFMSFSRQLTRLEEDGLATVTRIAVRPFVSFARRFAKAAGAGDHDLVFVSEVFFDTGFWIGDLSEIIAAVPHRAVVVIDGYHAFMAVPVDLGRHAARIVYIAGGYKYAMAGEGAAFMHVPAGLGLRPRDTGWFADFGALEGKGTGVQYPADARRFLGATFDASGLMRLNAVMDLLAREGLSVEAMTAHCRDLQSHFIDAMASSRAARRLPPSHLDPRRDGVGRFLAIETPDAARLTQALGARNIIVDHRRDLLRIGFGIYQDKDDVERLIGALDAVTG
jgi:selenocysteine lyase/cysteine desulfurase